MPPANNLPARLTARLAPDALTIFLFHGVINGYNSAVRNYTGKHINADLFARSMKQLAAAGHPISMNAVVEHIDLQEEFPPRAFAVTFDDGFENNLSVAAPILADLQIPVMIYLTTQFIETNRMSWIDRIEAAVDQAEAQSITAWSGASFEISDTASRIRFLKAVRTRVKNDPAADADAFATEVCTSLRVQEHMSSNSPLDLKMTWAQVREANESALITFGGHSHTHPILSFLAPDGLVAEIETSLSLLDTYAGIGPTHYSYPEGLSHCYSDAVVRELRRHGVRCCPTAIDGTNHATSDLFHLRRVMVDAATV